MYCKYCGKEIDDNNRWCNYCGKATGHGSDIDDHQSKPDYEFDSADDYRDASYDSTPAGGAPMSDAAVKQEMSKNGPPTAAMIVLCILFPLEGVVLGITWFYQGNKRAGKVYIILSLILLVATLLLTVIGIFLLGVLNR